LLGQVSALTNRVDILRRNRPQVARKIVSGGIEAASWRAGTKAGLHFALMLASER
jgi:hypothetical protein